MAHAVSGSGSVASFDSRTCIFDGLLWKPSRNPVPPPARADALTRTHAHKRMRARTHTHTRAQTHTRTNTHARARTYRQTNAQDAQCSSVLRMHAGCTLAAVAEPNPPAMSGCRANQPCYTALPCVGEEVEACTFHGLPRQHLERCPASAKRPVLLRFVAAAWIKVGAARHGTARHGTRGCSRALIAFIWGCFVNGRVSVGWAAEFQHAVSTRRCVPMQHDAT